MAVFARREERNQVWDDASVNVVEGFRVSSFSSRVLGVGTSDPNRNQRTAFCVQLVLSKSRICGELGTFSCEEVGDDTAARFAADVRGLCPQIRVCVFTLDLFVMSVVV